MALHKHAVFGLTGGIGCGKSAATDFFSTLGVRIIDTDEISHRLSAPPSPALDAIAHHFGDDYLTHNGALNRQRMREHVFSDASARTQLEAIFHPLIQHEVIQQLACPTEAPYSLLVVPLLFEKNSFQHLSNANIVIDCPEEQQISRVMSRSQLSRDETLAIMRTQLSRQERTKRANFVIHNDNTINNLHQQIRQLHQLLLNIATNLKE